MSMNREATVTILKSHEPELRALGVTAMSLFGSVARGEDDGHSDVDIAVRLTDGPHGFRYFGRLMRLEQRLSDLLGRPVDVIDEPAPAGKLQAAIERDRYLAF